MYWSSETSFFWGLFILQIRYLLDTLRIQIPFNNVLQSKIENVPSLYVIFRILMFTKSLMLFFFKTKINLAEAKFQGGIMTSFPWNSLVSVCPLTFLFQNMTHLF